MIDETESYRRAEIPIVNALSDSEIPEPKWTAATVAECFVIHSFMAPYCTATRKVDGVRGSLEFRHHPRVYFGFTPS